MTYMRSLALFPILVAAVVLSACMRKKEPVSWHTKVLTPIASSNLGIGNLVTRDLYRVENDSSLTVIYEKNLQKVEVDSIVPFDGKEYVERVLIRDFPITTREMEQSITLRDLMKNMDQDLQDILKNNDSSETFIPTYDGISAPAQTIEAEKVFTSADIITGSLSMYVTNELNFALKNITYTVRNKNDGALLGSGRIDTLSPGETELTKIILDGKHVEGTLLYEVTNIDVIGTFPRRVFLDLSKGLHVKVYADDLKAKLLTAIFPEQDFIQREFDTQLEGIGDKRLTKVKIKSGKIQIKYYSTSPDEVKFTYTIPDARIGADTFKFEGKFKRADNVDVAIDTIEKDISGFDLDLLLETPEGESPNRFKSRLSAGFEYTGRMVTITENDSIRMEIKLVDVVPSYASGYLGVDTFKMESTNIAFDAFKDLEKIRLALNDVKIRLDVTNGAGLGAKVNIDRIEGLNTSTGSVVALSLNEPSFKIPAAVETPFTESKTTYEINNSNSNVKAFLDNKPNQLSYKGMVVTNPDADPTNMATMPLTQFLTDQSSLNIDIRVETPLEVNVKDLSLEDTTDMSVFDLDNLDKIKDGTLSLLLENQLPVSMNLKLIVLDDKGARVDSIFSTTPVPAAQVEQGTGKVLSVAKHKIDYYFDTDKLRRLLSSKKIYFKAVLNSPDEKYAKLLVDSKLKVNLVGKFNYLVSSK